jgi:adenylate cyclase class 2
MSTHDRLEIEMKFPVADFNGIDKYLVSWGATFLNTHRERDQYFNAPDRDFARTDEALRLRRLGDRNFITYKGPKIDAQTKTRTEIQVALDHGENAAQDFALLLTHLHYRSVAVVRKTRTMFGVERAGFHVELCLDEVEGLGCFVELEIQAAANQLEAARAVLLKSATELGLTRSERRSYLEMLLERTEKRPS